MRIHCSASLLNFNRMMLRLLNNYRYQHFNKNLSCSTEDDYKRAVVALNLLQSNKQALADPKTRQHPESKCGKVVDFLSKCGLDLNIVEEKLSIIHVSGTKGKGSTCAYCESILRQYGYKTGFFSSPHLVSVRERIRINGQAISHKKFASYFWEVYGKLGAYENNQNRPEMPPYFMFLTIMAFKIFVEEKVDVAIIEVGIGGEYDCTNIIRNTAVVGISSLGYDHVKLLGKSIEEIAWQKSGIMKNNCIAITSWDQPPEALKILQERALERKCSLFIAPKFEEYKPAKCVTLGIRGPAQPINASLGVQLCHAWMNPQYYKRCVRNAPVFPLSDEIYMGLQNCSWPGRTQVFHHSNKLICYLDGAHNSESIQLCAKWFSETVPFQSKKALVFNVIGDRDPGSLMKYLIRCNFNYAFFCPNIVDFSKESLTSDFTNMKDSRDEEYEQSKQCCRKWLEINDNFNENDVKLFHSVKETLYYLENDVQEKEIHTLITGSLHLVGAFLSILDPELKYRDY